jgi:6-phosphogluconolactonase (cycloisomerase 2 family)
MGNSVDMLKPGTNHSPNIFQGSELQLSTDGRFLYAASRNNSLPAVGGDSNDDAIALFSVSPNGTYIERLGFYSSGNW